MGQAKKRNASANSLASLKAKLEGLGIDVSEPGFYDHPAFLSEEQRDARFLESYGQWVQARLLSDDESVRIRQIVPQLAEIITARLDRHQWFGSCVAVTGMLSRMLDRMGIWNCAFRGSVSVHDDERKASRYFAIVDHQEGSHTTTGHMWLSVPPIDILDVTLRFQRWQQDDFRDCLPKFVLAEHAEIVKPRAEDVVAPEIRSEFAMREGRRDPQLHYRLFPDQARIGRSFPALKVKLGSTDVRYVPAGISFPDVPLEQINTAGSAGVPAIEIWNDDVVPFFGLDKS